MPSPWTGEVPADVDAATHRRIARTFYIARVFRLSVLLVFALVALGVSLAGDESGWAVAVFGLLAVVVLSLLGRTWQRWRASASSFEA